MSFTLWITLFSSLFSVLNPIGAIPMYVSLTANRPPEERTRIARITAYTVLAVMLASLCFGEALLQLFGISLAAFRVGGGILILLMAIAMLHARRSGAKNAPEETIEAMHRTEIAVTPLGTPMLAGPGTMSTAILLREQIHSATEWGIILVVIAMLALVTYLLLRFSTVIVGYLGRTGINIVIRLMGLILAARAVEFIANGLKALFPVLG